MGDSTSNQPAVRPAEDENSIVQEISILLRDGRLDQGESIEEVARTLRINRRYLEAIEEGRFDDLPGPVYTLGFIRSFGDHVGLDGEELVRRFKAVSTSTTPRAELEFPEPIPESGVPGGAVLFAGLLVAVLAYGGWYMMSEDDNILSDLVAPVPEELAGQAGDATNDVANDTAGETDETPLIVDEEPAAAADQAETGVVSGDVAIETVEETATPDPEPVAATEPEPEPVTAAEPESTADSVSEPESETAAALSESADTAAIEPLAAVEPETASGTEIAADPESDTASEPAASPEPQPDAAPDDESVAEVADSLETAENVETEVSAAADATAADATADDATQSLNEAQLQAMQAGMIDVPTVSLEGADEPAAEDAAEDTAEATAGDAEPVAAEPDAVADARTDEETAGEDTTVEDTTVDETADEETAGEDATDDVTADAEPAEPADEAPDATETAALSEPDAEPATAAEDADPETAEDAAADPEPGLAAGVPDRGVVIVAREDSWIEVRDSVNNDVIVSKILRAGEYYQVPRAGEFELATGNAGALGFVVDGEELPPIGGGGQIGRNIRLDAESLLERQGGTGR